MAMRDEYLDMWPHLNRTAVVIRPKRALYDWLNNADPKNAVDPDKDRDDSGTVYLLQAVDMIDEWEGELKRVYKKIFEAELWSWMRDDAMWPKDRSWEKFCEFFEYEFNSTIADLDEETEIYEDDVLE